LTARRYEPGHDRDGEGDGLATAGATATEHVLAGEGVRKRGRLDGKGKSMPRSARAATMGAGTPRSAKAHGPGTGAGVDDGAGWSCSLDFLWYGAHLTAGRSQPVCRTRAMNGSSATQLAHEVWP
jgi:hypothetical protein